MNPKGRTRYFVYRGLTHYRRGERGEALHYLQRGKSALEHGDPNWIPVATVRQMDEALQELSSNGGG